MTAEERQEALAFLKSPRLVERIGDAFTVCGLVGEETNRLAAYLACTSRKLEKPLAVIIQSTSAAGKSTLMEAVLAMFPEEERVKYSAMTGQSLYYLGETNLKHKILAIVEEEGAEKASYALKLLQSEGELTIASTGKDPQTGRMETQEYHVEGPVMIFLTTTAIDIDEELQNRCLTLTVDESREQTERIHTLQRKARTLEGLRMKKERRRLLTLMRNAQRLLQPMDVMNPWADDLTFTAERTRTRRDHEKYLTLIDAVALLHQYQRPMEVDREGTERSEFIRVTLEDIALANRLALELLGRSLDELPPQTRRLYETIKQIVRERCASGAVEQRHAFFSRRDVRVRLGWSVTQIRIHLDRLRELEYIAARFGRPGSAFQYELLTDCREVARAEHIGLLDVEKLRLRQQPDGENAHLTGGWRTPARKVQSIQEPALALNLTA
jgi:energy-coupling factor transporter ATP-binding protein EcfA2